MPWEPRVVSIEINQECPLNCPFCYSRPRRRGCRWSRERLSLLLGEAASLPGDTVIVFGDGEPLLTPRLTGWAMRRALGEGAVQTGFTTSGVPLEAMRLVEEEYGGPLAGGEASVTVSLDHYKLRVEPKCRVSNAEVGRAWRWTAEALRVGGEGEPEALCSIEWAWSRGWSVAVNFLVTREAPLVTPLLAALAREGLIEQVNLLAPKPLDPLLPRAFVPVAARIAAILEREGVRVAVDASMRQLLTGEPGCEAGRRLYSVSACGLVRPCSFSPLGVEWRPGLLGEIVERVGGEASRVRRGFCPFLADSQLD